MQRVGQIFKIFLDLLPRNRIGRGFSRPLEGMHPAGIFVKSNHLLWSRLTLRIYVLNVYGTLAPPLAPARACLRLLGPARACLRLLGPERAYCAVGQRRLYLPGT